MSELREFINNVGARFFRDRGDENIKPFFRRMTPAERKQWLADLKDLEAKSPAWQRSTWADGIRILQTVINELNA